MEPPVEHAPISVIEELARIAPEARIHPRLLQVFHGHSRDGGEVLAHPATGETGAFRMLTVTAAAAACVALGCHELPNITEHAGTIKD
jgi:acyl-CoA reductase-like NAD-dependent aldehyde dehydrogenase